MKDVHLEVNYMFICHPLIKTSNEHIVLVDHKYVTTCILRAYYACATANAAFPDIYTRISRQNLNKCTRLSFVNLYMLK